MSLDDLLNHFKQSNIKSSPSVACRKNSYSPKRVSLVEPHVTEGCVDGVKVDFLYKRE